MVVKIPKEAIASDLMKRDAITVTPDKTIDDARWLFRTHRIGGLPVVENGKLVGIFTLVDLKKRRLGTTRLREVMTMNPIVAYEDDTIVSVFDKMVEHRIGRIPIVSKSNGEMRGLVSLTDIKNLSLFHAKREVPGGSVKGLKCQSCTGPLGMPTGRYVKCPYCGTINEI